MGKFLFEHCPILILFRYVFSTFQICLFNTFGFLLHVSAGTVEIVAAREAEANGATVSFTKTKKTFQIIHHNTKSCN